MRYLITGGAGFIGSHLADALIDDGHAVHVLDNLSTGQLENVRHLADHERFTLTVGSVLDYRTLEQCVVDCDRIVHLAAAVGVRLIMQQPVETIHTNVGGTENVLQLAHYHNKKTLIASTSEVYGKAMQNGHGTVDALSEDDDWSLGPTVKRRWAYACSKAMDEFLARAYHDEHDLPVVCVRFFNTVGPRQSANYGMVVPSFVERALTGAPIEVHGDGAQTRCFTHVADAVQAVIALMNTPEAEGEIVNVGQSEEISINDLAQRVLALTRSSSTITHVPYAEAYGPGFEDMKRRTPNITKLQALTGFTPQHSTADILHDVIAYVRQKQSTAMAPDPVRGTSPALHRYVLHPGQ